MSEVRQPTRQTEQMQAVATGQPRAKKLIGQPDNKIRLPNSERKIIGKEEAK